jgi:hypothetical protein
MSFSPFIRMYQSSSHCTDIREIWYWRLLWKTVEKIKIWLKSDKNIEQFALRYKCNLLLPVTLNHHKSAVFEWNGIRLLQYPRRCKKHADTPQYYGIRALPAWCFSLCGQSAVGFKFSKKFCQHHQFKWIWQWNEDTLLQNVCSECLRHHLAAGEGDTVF